MAKYSKGMFKKRPRDNIFVIFLCVYVCPPLSWVVLSTVLLCKASSASSVFLKKKMISNTQGNVNMKKKVTAHNAKKASSVNLVHTKSSYPLTSDHSIVPSSMRERGG